MKIISQKAKNGEPLKFLLKSLDVETDECIEWPYAKNTDGYGLIRVGKSMPRVTRIVLQKVFGPAPESKTWALHRCSNPPCFNPRHLYWGSAADNSQDRVDEGNQPYGEKNSHAKLVEQQVLDIRADKRKHKVIAEEYGVYIGTVSEIKRRKTWSHV